MSGKKSLRSSVTSSGCEADKSVMPRRGGNWFEIATELQSRSTGLCGRDRLEAPKISLPISGYGDGISSQTDLVWLRRAAVLQPMWV